MTPSHSPAESHTPSEQRAAESSLGELISEVSRDFSTLMRQELDLAKAELTQSAKRAGKGSGLYAGAGYAALMAVFFLSVALWRALGHLVGLGWSAVIVAVIWAIIGGVLFTIGRSQMEKIKGVPQTVDTLKRIPETLKKDEENR